MHPKPLLLAGVLLGGILLGGCIEKVDETKTTSGDNGGMTAQLPATGGNAGAPQANNGRITQDQQPTDTGAPPMAANPGGSDATGERAALVAKVSDAEAKLAKKPNDPGLKKLLALALYNQGQQIMLDDNLMPRDKYGPALKLFNRALTLDPALSDAKQSKDTIEGIYRQMGRPIPQ